MRVFYPPFEDARDDFDCILYAVKSCLQRITTSTGRLVPALDATYMGNLTCFRIESFVHAPFWKASEISNDLITPDPPNS